MFLFLIFRAELSDEEWGNPGATSDFAHCSPPLETLVHDEIVNKEYSWS